MKPAAPQQIAERIEGFAALDGPAAQLQKWVRAAVPQGTELKDFLSGTWLGHPLHPPLTDTVIGCWTSALLLDLVGGEDTKNAADGLVGVGVLAAVPTAAAGLSDWAELSGGARRVGAVHAAGNSTALLLQTLSWTARRRGDRGRGVTLSLLGYGVATFSAWLGGHLSFSRGVGVNQTAFEAAPEDWTAVLGESELADERLTSARAGDLALLLVRKQGRIYAVADRCSHRGCALHKGELVAETIVCPCHGSTFRLDGSVARGPATSPQPSYEVRTREGKIEIRGTRG